MKAVKGISLLLVVLIIGGRYTLCFAPTQTRYYRSDKQTVNGLYAYKLDTSNSASIQMISLVEPISNGTGHYSSSVYIRHSNGTTTQLGTQVAMTIRSANGGGMQSATWNCPETSLSSTDAIQIEEFVDIDYGFYTSEYFITEQLGWSKLNSATWTFYRYTERYAGGSETEVYTDFGISNYCYITNISYTIYVDIGLRMREAGQTVTIACEPAGSVTSPLRIAKGGNIYGIALVDTNNSMASKFRIKTSGGIKALRKM